MDIFKREQQAVGGVFTSDKAVAHIVAGNGSWASAMIQNIQANYSQDFQELYELGSNNVYRVLGRPKGRMSIQRIIGKSGNVPLEEALFDACNTGGTMVINARANLCGAQGGSLVMEFRGLFVIDVGYAIATTDMLIRENLTLAFTSFNRTIS